MSSSVVHNRTNKNILAMIYKSVSQSSSREREKSAKWVYGHDVMRPRSRTSAVQLVNLLLGHGARAKRGINPYSKTRLNVMTPTGKRAIRIQFG